MKFCFAFLHDPARSTPKPRNHGGRRREGMKIRPAHATMASWVTQLGGTNVNASAPEVRDIIEKGVAEACDLPWGSIPLSHRQGHQVSHGCAALRDELRLGDEQGEV